MKNFDIIIIGGGHNGLVCAAYLAKAGKSVMVLDESIQARFARLGAFAAKPATFDLKSMAAVWRIASPDDTVTELVRRGLLEYLPDSARYQMHAVVHDLAKYLLQGPQLSRPLNA